jgi:hypothetical protein
MKEKWKTVNEPNGNLTKEEMKAMVVELAEKLGYSPSMPEIEHFTLLRRRLIRRSFGNLNGLLRECGLGARPSTQRVPIKRLFTEWAGVVRQLQKIPSITEFETITKKTVHCFQRRFLRWTRVPSAMWDYAKAEGLEEEWADVLELIRHHQEYGLATTVQWPGVPRWPLAIRSDRPVYGPAITTGPMVNEPTNESGVIFLFGGLAVDLGFRATLIRTEYPDCEALREMAPGRWQKMKIEFEYESRNFVKHGHRIEDCDLIVCWIDNWLESPIEVIELRSALSKLQSAIRQTKPENL